MRKSIKRLLTIALMFCLTVTPMFSASAASAQSNEIVPFYNNTRVVRTYCSVDDNGELAISYNVDGISGVTTKIIITTYIEKKILGLFWTRVDNGQANDQWVNTYHTSKYNGERYFDLPSTGTFRVNVTYVVYGSGGSADSIPYEAELGIKTMLDNVHQRLKDMTDKIDKLMADGEIPTVKYTCLLREGIPEEEILAFAREESPLMIVMGTRGENMPEYGLMGSVTAEVIERSPVFVYSIPEEAGLTNFKEIHKVAFITNFDQRDLIAFDSLITTFKDYNFEIYFIHLNSNEERRTWNEIKLSGIKEYFHKQYPDLAINYSLVTEDSFFNNLDDYVKKECIDVLCVSNYKRNVFARLFNPSIAKKMIFHSRTPILVIK